MDDSVGDRDCSTACVRSGESLEDRLIEAEKRLAEAEERIAAYEWETATLTPAPTATPTLLSGAGLTIRERYEDLAHVGLVVRTEERRTLSGCNNPARCNVSDWKYEDVTVFTVPEGLGGWVIRFTDVPGGDARSNFSQEGGLYIYHPANPGSNQGYIRAHNVWACSALCVPMVQAVHPRAQRLGAHRAATWRAGCTMVTVDSPQQPQVNSTEGTVPTPTQMKMGTTSTTRSRERIAMI